MEKLSDTSYIPIFITIITFLGSLVLFIYWIPTDFYTATALRGVDTRTFESGDLIYYNNTWSHYLNTTDSWWIAAEPSILNLPVSSGDFGGWNLRLEYSKAYEVQHILRCTHVHSTYWGVIPSDHRMTFSFNGYNRGTILTIDEIESDMNTTTGNRNLVKYSSTCDHFTFQLFLTYNTTAFPSLLYAWDNYSILATTGIRFDEMNTGLNAWSVLSNILFFNLPNTHWTVNALLAIPIYASVIILSFILVLEVIKALPLT